MSSLATLLQSSAMIFGTELGPIYIMIGNIGPYTRIHYIHIDSHVTRTFIRQLRTLPMFFYLREIDICWTPRDTNYRNVRYFLHALLEKLPSLFLFFVFFPFFEERSLFSKTFFLFLCKILEILCQMVEMRSGYFAKGERTNEFDF